MPRPWLDPCKGLKPTGGNTNEHFRNRARFRRPVDRPRVERRHYPVHDIRRRHQAAAARYRHPGDGAAGLVGRSECRAHALVSTALYALPSTSVLGAILLTAYMGGAIATNARIGNPLFSHTLFGVYLGIILWGGLYLRDPRVRALIPFSR
ncbi:DoxX family protein [Mesorhizobium australicum]